jgi:hypothetical protein
MQSLNSNSFPMEQYFVYVTQTDSAPIYLGSADEETDHIEVTVEGVSQNHDILVMYPHTWPSADELGLDRSQYQALQAALTKELVVIQGPPGTGKTYMALKIAGILIQNKQKMGRSTPILVVCLTNHALDQFLVGMLNFTNSLVRIGGQSKEDRLNEYNLKNLKVKRSKQQFNLMDSINRNYKDLEIVEGQLSGVSSAASFHGFLMDPEVCGVLAHHSSHFGFLVKKCFDLSKFIMIIVEKKLPLSYHSLR